MLEPYTVLDFTDERGEIGPMILGDLGAEVIKIELPEGASSRRAAPFDTRTLTKLATFRVFSLLPTTETSAASLSIQTPMKIAPC